MSHTTTFQKVKDFLQKLCSFNSRKNKKIKSKKNPVNQNQISILIATQSYNYKNNEQLTIQEKIYAEQFKFHDDTYYDEDNIK